MKSSLSPHTPPERVQHPAVETFERVMNNGIVVECDWGGRGAMSFDVSVAGVDVDLLGAAPDNSTHPIRRALFQSLRESPPDDTAYEVWQTTRAGDRGLRHRDRSRK